ncbi:hypothetical protein SOCEGT47_073270 [Sorangium cellulosum]|uniref:Secreted protein n=1 Tax=Sorangium cellulosum TaxID=56 RepID=A0A4P2QAR5_SORCE|nr:hypothetical protein [Sorangium cellulosum]AUX26757.1 hypothetical protein SOCEGT47_073270 [Sorangium cellulosum]
MRTGVQARVLMGAVAALALGALASGCLWEPSDDSLGRFCAMPANGDEDGKEYCVGANRSPGDAWSQAERHGDLPIEMWADLPRGVAMRELAGSEDMLDLWLGNVDKVVSYVRDQERNAESYGATLAGKLRFLLDRAAGQQRSLLEEEPVRAADRFKEAMTEKANAEKEPLVAALAEDKQAMAAVQAIFEQARDDAAPLQAEYANVVERFAEYRATEAAETAAVAALSEQASRSALEGLEAVEEAILAAAREASRAPGELSVAIMALSARIQASAVALDEALAPHKELLATHGAAMPDMSSGALRSLNAMLGYVQQRVARSDRTAAALLGGIRLRRQALLALQGDEGAREASARSRSEKASATFLAGAQARAAALAKPPPATLRLGLPPLADRCRELSSLLQMRPLCEASSSSWREAGCAALRDRFEAAETELTTTLPRMIAEGLAALRAQGVDAALLDAAQARLDAGDVIGAAIAHDAAVSRAEGT